MSLDQKKINNTMTPQDAYNYVMNLPEVPPPTPVSSLQQQHSQHDEEPETPSSGSAIQNDPPAQQPANARYRSASVVINTDNNNERRKRRQWITVYPSMSHVRDIAVIVLSFMLVVFAMAMVVVAYVMEKDVGIFVSILFLVFGFYVDKPKFGLERKQKKSIEDSV